ncbi:polysaccharide deacetylase [Pseudoduganella flava]|uniref:Polysaccharide deacetylase n=1 Tax=Pseudoduganella flava TaxID=871742 RepID=A0A562PNH6_9BURK|nr:polysaccharide deacetylase family protein [Pseudoduganella flava]QGZ40575.1 polysaccharide deacetylase family protein [Pseudoduganella flava]TWI46021.1 polysaccharide deacetylase [Pseudoduganella flava]
MRTRVCISIDTEFSIGGAFTDPARLPVAEPMVWCEVDGRSQGLGFLLDTFERHRIPATFFVEAAQRYYFRDADPMGTIARRIAAHGHEVQLHTHPCWSVFRHDDWREQVTREPRQDDFYGRAEEDTVHLLRQGQETFADWGVPLPTVFRSGNLQHDDTLFAAMARCGIPYSSCVGLAVFDSGDARYRLYSGAHPRHGVLEMPVLTFEDWRIGGRRHRKTLTIAGTSFAETRLLLERAHEQRVPLVVILTHPFEYVQRRDDGMRTARRNALHQGRLERLCRYLDCNRDRFQPTGLGEAGSALQAAPDERNVLLQGSGWRSVRRLAEQVAYDRYGKWALARRGAPA